MLFFSLRIMPCPHSLTTLGNTQCSGNILYIIILCARHIIERHIRHTISAVCLSGTSLTGIYSSCNEQGCFFFFLFFQPWFMNTAHHKAAPLAICTRESRCLLSCSKKITLAKRKCWCCIFGYAPEVIKCSFVEEGACTTQYFVSCCWWLICPSIHDGHAL